MEPVLGQLLVPKYSLALVLLSYFISFLGSLLALQCAKWMFRINGSLDWELALCAAIALGGIGIWSMHFIGMQAYRLAVPITYDLLLTVISLIAAIAISGIALYLAGKGGKFTLSGWLAGSLLAGVGVCVMHYMGMYAMHQSAIMSLDPATVGISVGIAIVAAAAALWLAFNLTKLSHRIVAAVVMGVAVCSMHYVGMSAASMICSADLPASMWQISGDDLGIWVFGVASAVLLYIFWVVSGHSIDQAKLQAG
ncbi:MHYT domain-containing protein, NO-binding membrane sensor [Collimonas sp. OK307]|uniref:MHYT domain-containing protein n=1 Tax=Collimonas sp. OK307 TaxID=1801620 RepID=UPI0008E5DD6D|nr:MHYT domain-containing protein [Collimonas sp. OK307]SFH93508.1 MHYT domain-containing protein, NO-binding membrane sensor [Collimonas sp. OK307]